MRESLRKNKKNLLVLMVVLVSLPVAIYLVQQAIRLFTRATGEATTLYFSPSPVNLTTTSQDVSLMLNANAQKVAFTSVTFSFDKTKVNLASEIVTSDKLKTVNSKTTMEQANQTGLITISLGLSTADVANPPTGIFELAKMQFKAVSADPGTSAFNFGNKQIVNIEAAELTAGSDITQVSLNTAMATASSQPITGQVSFTISAANQSMNVGDNVNVNFSLNPSSQSVVGTDLVVNYNPASLEIVNTNSINANTYFGQTANVVINNTLGKLTLSLLVPTDQPAKTVQGEFMTVGFRAKSAGTAAIGLGQETIVAGTGASGQNLEFTANTLNLNVLSPTPAPTPSPSPSMGPTLPPIPTPISSQEPSASAAPRSADINNDGQVNLLDYLALFQFYGSTQPGNARADINRDGRVNIRDYAVLYEQYDR